jgi:hypothetical protein
VNVELASVVDVVLADADGGDAVVVSEAVDAASVVVAVRAETMSVLKVAMMMRLIMRTLAAEHVIIVGFMIALLTNNFLFITTSPFESR